MTTTTGHVYVAQDQDPFSDGELYVFAVEEDAETFVATRSDSWRISEEPILDAEFARAAAEEA